MRIPKTFEQSFASHPKSKYWSELNELKPDKVFKSSPEKILFNCDTCNHIFIIRLDRISCSNGWCQYCANQILCKDNDCKICFNKSFESNTKSNFWSNKNKLKPRFIFKKSNQKFWFDCKTCNHDFETTISNITAKNCWCPFCSGHKICNNDDCEKCFNKSFASNPKSQYWSNLNKVTPRQVFNVTSDKYLFNCKTCNHEFKMSLSCDSWCPYCSSSKLCNNKNCNYCFNKSYASHPKSIYWSDKNKLKPRQVFKGSSTKYWFNCDKCKHDFKLSSPNTWCPKCRYKTELKLLNWFKQQQLNIKLQATFDWCKIQRKLPFDFLLEEYNLIIELDGKQHFEQVSNWTSPEETKVRDDFKNISANTNGYSVIRLCQRIVWNDLEDWENQLKDAIKIYNNQDSKLIKIGSVYEI